MRVRVVLPQVEQAFPECFVQLALYAGRPWSHSSYPIAHLKDAEVGLQTVLRALYVHE